MEATKCVAWCLPLRSLRLDTRLDPDRWRADKGDISVYQKRIQTLERRSGRSNQKLQLRILDYEAWRASDCTWEFVLDEYGRPIWGPLIEQRGQACGVLSWSLTGTTVAQGLPVKSQFLANRSVILTTAESFLLANHQDLPKIRIQTFHFTSQRLIYMIPFAQRLWLIWRLLNSPFYCYAENNLSKLQPLPIFDRLILGMDIQRWVAHSL